VPDLTICPCQNCGGNIEFDPAEFTNQTNKVQCPHCGAETELLIPVDPPREQEQAAPLAGTLPIDLCPQSERRMFIIVTTSNEVSGRTIDKYLGIARGIVVRSPTGSQAFMGGMKEIFGGGNIEAFAQLCEQARKDAYWRMVDHANSHKAYAIIAFRYDATEFSPNVTEVLAYGTAVTFRRD
jgi:uncharacterized protein YbjQ (UPF0145 family)